jgi:hypothetical protein
MTIHFCDNSGLLQAGVLMNWYSFVQTVALAKPDQSP